MKSFGPESAGATFFFHGEQQGMGTESSFSKKRVKLQPATCMCKHTSTLPEVVRTESSSAFTRVRIR